MPGNPWVSLEKWHNQCSHGTTNKTNINMNSSITKIIFYRLLIGFYLSYLEIHCKISPTFYDSFWIWPCTKINWKQKGKATTMPGNPLPWIRIYYDLFARICFLSAIGLIRLPNPEEQWNSQAFVKLCNLYPNQNEHITKPFASTSYAVRLCAAQY